MSQNLDIFYSNTYQKIRFEISERNTHYTIDVYDSDKIVAKISFPNFYLDFRNKNNNIQLHLFYREISILDHNIKDLSKINIEHMLEEVLNNTF